MRRMLFAVIITTLVGVAVASGAKEGGAPNNNDLFKSIIGKVTKLKKKPQGGKVNHIRMNQAQQHLANYTGVAPQEFLGDFDGYPAINTCLAGSKAFRTIFNGDNDGAEPATGKQKYYLRKRGLILDDSTLTKDAAFVLASTAYPNGIRVITLDKLHFNYGIALESIWEMDDDTANAALADLAKATSTGEGSQLPPDLYHDTLVGTQPSAAMTDDCMPDGAGPSTPAVTSLIDLAIDPNSSDKQGKGKGRPRR